MAKTVNEELLDALIRHQTYLLRYSSSVRNKIWELLAKSEPLVVAAVRRKLETFKGGLNTKADVARMQKLLVEIDGIRHEAWKNANDWLTQQMIDLAYQEPIVMSSLVQSVAPVVVTTTLPAAATLRALVTTRPFEGGLLKEWAAGMEKADLRRIHAQIQFGMVAGETTDVIVSRVMGASTMDATRRQVQSIVRTAIQSVANNARAEFLRENADLFTVEQFVATLDSRTTPVCRAQDGKQYPVGTGPQPPLHIGCRSLRVAVMSDELLGMRPAKASTQKMLLREFADERGLGKVTSRDELPRGTKGDFDEWARKRVRQLTGRVPSATSYQNWLTNQTAEFQRDTLGVAKAKLFRSGGLTLDKFVAADGTELTLEQLAGKYAAAFRAAGLDPKQYTD